MSPLLCPPIEENAEGLHGGGEGTNKVMSSGLQANFETLKKRKLDEASARRVAEETANLVESEIEQLRNSVAELEAMLLARQQQQEDEEDDPYDDDSLTNTGGEEDEMDRLPEKNRFPLLPPDVVAIGTGSVGDVDSDLEGDDEEYGE